MKPVSTTSGHFARLAVVALYAGGVLLGIGCGKRGDETTPQLQSETATSGLDSPQLPEGHLDRIVEQFNLGVALMEQYRAAAAVEAFDEVVDLAPGWTRGRLNLGLALMNVQDPEAHARAETELRRVIDEVPDDPYAHFALGILLRHLVRADEARREFETVLTLRPDDPDAHYQLAILSLQEQPETAREHLEATLRQVPHHESACYQLQALLRRQGEVERADELLTRFQTLKTTGAGITSRMRYGEMGRYAEVIRSLDGAAVDAAHAPPRLRNEAQRWGLAFATDALPGWPGEVTGAARRPGARHFGPGIAVADVDLDGDLDLYVPGVRADQRGALYENEGGTFVEVEDAGIDGSKAVGAYFGDYDADGDPDLYLTCDGPNRMYRNEGERRFADATNQTGTAGGAHLSLGAAWADADHDGDIDLYVANYSASSERTDGGRGAPNVLWRNNGDDTFIDVAAEAGIHGANAASTGVLFLDVDDDRDLDLYVVHDGSKNQLFVNNRAGQYDDATEWYASLADDGPGTGAVLGDVNQDGREDVLLLRGPQPPRLFLQVARGRFVDDGVFAAQLGELGAVGALLCDLDLDGDPDLFLVGAGSNTASSHRLLVNRGAGRFDAPTTVGQPTAGPKARGAVAADLDGNGALELVVAQARGPAEVWQAEAGPKRHWLQMVAAQATTTGTLLLEPRALGALVEVKTGTRMQLARVTSSSGYLGGMPAVLHFGLGEAAEADYARISWPDAVLQSEIEIAADRVWRVQKVERKPSSCPLLFVWNGQRFEYVTDFLGVGGVGFFVAPGEYAPPDPTEDVRIPPGALVARAGRYLIRIAEPLEEVTYLDAVHLMAYDHPSGVEVYPDERFTAAAPLPTGRPRVVAEKIFPVTALDRNGTDVLSRVRSIDRDYVEPPKHPRFVGYAEDHWVELDFGTFAPPTRDAHLVLYLYGWVEYTYSHVNYAAHQAGLAMRPPSIEVPDGSGGWRVVVPEMGFPAGLPRMMTFDLSAVGVAQHTRFRIRTNMEIFWDQIFVGWNVDAAVLRAHRLEPAVAELRHLGYPLEHSPDGALPTVYDYHRLDPGVGFKNMRGPFTAYGDVLELLGEVDDRFVLMARGTEIALEFDATRLPKLKPGWSRTWALHADGYCKDMDLYTAFPETVEPLPYHAMRNYPPKGAPESERLDAAARNTPH